MRKYGLIGYPLAHSFSASYFARKFKEESICDAVYSNYPIQKIDDLPRMITEDKELCGLNVTIPYKKQVMQFLDEIDGEALRAGAVNVVKILRNNNDILLRGYNTDIYGFRESLSPFIARKIKQALVLGTGGSSASVAYVLEDLNINIVFVSRQPGNNCITYGEVTGDLIKTSELIVNTTPVGMFPAIDQKPAIPYDELTPSHILYDLIYNPEKTIFLKEGERRGCSVVNGLTMLKLQAEKSWQIWNDPSC